jgi:hypothetical protein
MWAIITLDPTTPNTIVISIHTPPQLIILELGSRGQSFDVHNQVLKQWTLMQVMPCSKAQSSNVDNTIILEPRTITLRHCVETQRHHVFFMFFSSSLFVPRIFVSPMLTIRIHLKSGTLFKHIGVPLHILLCNTCSLQDVVSKNNFCNYDLC